MYWIRISWKDRRNTTALTFKTKIAGDVLLGSCPWHIRRKVFELATVGKRLDITPEDWLKLSACHPVTALLGLEVTFGRLDGRTRFAKGLKYYSVPEVLNFYGKYNR